MSDTQAQDAPPAEDPVVEEALRACIAHHEAGRLAEARAGLEAVLADHPDNANALHLLGLVRFAQGDTEDGAALVGRALERAPEFSAAAGNLATMLRMMRRPDEAMALLRKTVGARPDDPEALRNIGFSLMAQGDAAEAAEMFLKAVRLTPDDPLVHAGLGGARLVQQRYQEAEASLRQALGLAPANPEIHMHLAVALRALGKPDEAIGSLRVALLLRSNYPEARTNLGLFLLERGRVDEALASLRQAVAEDPQRGQAHFAIGQILAGQGDTAGAVASLRRALATLANPTLAYNAVVGLFGGAGSLGELIEVERVMAARQPGAAGPQVRLARALARAGRLDEAVAACERALAISPGALDATGAIAAIRYVQGRTEEARAAFGAVLAKAPGDAAARTTLAMMQLADGNFADGLPGLEARFDLPQLAAFRPEGVPLAPLAKAPVAGKRVLLAAEQGIGDTLHFVRYAPLLAARGARVLLEVQAPLVRLLAGMPGVEAVSAQGAAAPQVDATCAMMSLPLVFGTGIDSIPDAVPYLAAPAQQRAGWSARLGPAVAGRRRVGLCWSGNPGFSADQFRSIPLAMFQVLLADPTLEVHLVQTDIRDGDDAVVAAAPGVRDWRRELGDFADTAAVIEQMDLVISVDTAVAHLAGALGRPVWILLPYAADWRWLQVRRNSPWYPTAQLFRQPALGDWQPVLDGVRAALQPR